MAQPAPDILARAVAQMLQVISLAGKNDGIAGATLLTVARHAVTQGHGFMLEEQTPELGFRGIDQPVVGKRLKNSHGLAMPIRAFRPNHPLALTAQPFSVNFGGHR